MNESAHARYLRGGRQSEALVCYAITKCVENRRPILVNDDAADILFGSLDFMRTDDRLRLLAFCVMPDHIHLLFVLLSKCSLQELMRDYCRFTARAINRLIGTRGNFWQEGFHDHRCRDSDDTFDRLTYIENNPVRAGLVANAADWPYSSAYPNNSRLLDRDWFAANC